MILLFPRPFLKVGACLHSSDGERSPTTPDFQHIVLRSQLCELDQRVKLPHLRLLQAITYKNVIPWNP